MSGGFPMWVIRGTTALCYLGIAGAVVSDKEARTVALLYVGVRLLPSMNETLQVLWEDRHATHAAPPETPKEG